MTNTTSPGENALAVAIAVLAARFGAMVRTEDAADHLARALVRRLPGVVWEDGSLRDAADQMVTERVGRLPVVRRDDPRAIVGILSRRDLLAAR